MVGMIFAKGDGDTFKLGTPQVPDQIVLDSHDTPTLEISDHHSARMDVTASSLMVSTITDEGRRMSERRKQGKAGNSEQANKSEPESRLAVRLGTGEGGGGIADCYNTFGKRVASVQADKANQGQVIVWDVNGKESKGLVAP